MDESGDLGFNFSKKGTSRYFVMTALIAEQVIPIYASVRRTLKTKLRQKKKTRYVEELKGSSTTFMVKKYFNQQMLRADDWYLCTVILDKKESAEGIQKPFNLDQLYNLVSMALLNQIKMTSIDKTINLHIDKSKSRRERALFNMLTEDNMRPRLSPETKINIMHVQSQADLGVQAADLFCYGIARKYEQKDVRWYDLFKSRVRHESQIKKRRPLKHTVPADH